MTTLQVIGSFSGNVDIITTLGSEIIDHLSAQVFCATDLVPQITPDGLTGEYFWRTPADIAPNKAVAGCHGIIHWLESADRVPLLELIMKSPQ